MAAKGTKGTTKAPATKAEQAATTAAPAAAEQLVTQPAATTGQPTPAPGANAAPSVVDSIESNSGQDAQPNTDQAAADAAAATSSPASAAPEASVGDAAAAAVLAADTSDVLDDDGDVEGLWITAVPEQGFRRCGFRFTREGFGIALSALTEQQIEQLEREPNLKVERGMFSGLVA